MQVTGTRSGTYHSTFTTIVTIMMIVFLTNAKSSTHIVGRGVVPEIALVFLPPPRGVINSCGNTVHQTDDNSTRTEINRNQKHITHKQTNDYQMVIRRNNFSLEIGTYGTSFLLLNLFYTKISSFLFFVVVVDDDNDVFVVVIADRGGAGTRLCEISFELR